jgi:hypothetical protein
VGPWLVGAALLAGLGALAPAEAGGKKTPGVWTDPQDKTLPPDFKIQGEYVGEYAGGGKLGCQVIALGNGAFQAVVLPGGLPGDGWDGKTKILMAGKLEGEQGVFTPAAGKRKYLAQKPEDFSATQKFPPPGQKDYTATIAGGVLTGKTDEGKDFKLMRVMRSSPSLGAKPANGLMLFDGTDAKQFDRGRVENGILNTDGNDIVTKKKFLNYTVHCEFMLPYRPDARGQGRGNSGFYMVDLYEVQILDSFGLDGLKNECGGVYERLAPKVNSCLPPLQWQTYDIDFTSAVEENGKKVKNARITARLNGIVIHDDAEIAGTTGGARKEPEGTAGVLRLQGHGNPLQFRNIWIVEKL